VSLFVATHPTTDAYWHAIILFGKNSAAYKFALASALLPFAQLETTVVRLDELADPFSSAVCSHLKSAGRQGTSGKSKFLEACRQFNAGDLPRAELLDRTVKLGFINVLDAYHVVTDIERRRRND